MMKKYILATFAIGILAIHGNGQVKETAPKAKKEQTKPVVNKVVNQAEFKKQMARKEAQLIDVRTSEEYSGGHIGNAKNIDFNGPDFKAKMAKLDKNKPVLVYCQGGVRSAKAAAVLKEMGFKEVYDLQGGYGSWKK